MMMMVIIAMVIATKKTSKIHSPLELGSPGSELVHRAPAPPSELPLFRITETF